MRRKTLIRPVGPEDLRDIFLLGQAIFRENPHVESTWEAAGLADLLSSPEGVALAAVQRNKIIAFIIGTIPPKNMGSHSIIQWAGVMEKQRRHGTGRALCESFFEKSRAKGCGHSVVKIPPGVPDAVEFFSKIGFTEKDRFISLDFNLHSDDS